MDRWTVASLALFLGVAALSLVWVGALYLRGRRVARELDAMEQAILAARRTPGMRRLLRRGRSRT